MEYAQQEHNVQIEEEEEEAYANHMLSNVPPCLFILSYSVQLI